MKEAYSSNLLLRLFEDAGYVPPTTGLSLFDPFSGSGTTALSAIGYSQSHGLACRVRSVELNPFLAVVSRAKVAGARFGSELASRIRGVRPVIEEVFVTMLEAAGTSPSTGSVTLKNAKYFSPRNAVALLALGSAVKTVSDPDVVAVLQTCVAAAVEPSGRLRRDGRALRFVPDRTPRDPFTCFAESLIRVLTDLDALGQPETCCDALVLAGDARNETLYDGSQKFDWIICSPPYPNNIDYTEVYKVEAWVLGLYGDASQMKLQRLATMRSHSSLLFPDDYRFRVDSSRQVQVGDLIEPLLQSVPGDRYARGRRQLIAGYADDMLRVLELCRRVASENGKAAFVVGNSSHGSDDKLTIASDVLLARLAELSGWQVDEIRIARSLHRRGRGSRFLRESVVVLDPA